MFSCKINLDTHLPKGKKAMFSFKNCFFLSKQNNGPAPTLVDLANGTSNPVPPSAPAAPPSVNQSQIQPLTGIQFNVTDFKPSKTSRQLCEENGIRFDHSFKIINIQNYLGHF